MYIFKGPRNGHKTAKDVAVHVHGQRCIRTMQTVPTPDLEWLVNNKLLW